MTLRPPPKGAIAPGTETEGTIFTLLGRAASSPSSPAAARGGLKLLACLLCFLSSSAAQSIAITTPANTAVIAGFSFRLTCSVSSISTLAYVQYLVDGETVGYVPAAEPHTCPSLPWNTYNVGNGATHTFQAIALDSTYTVLATSAMNTAAVENWLPQQTCLYSDTPSSACGGLTVTASPAASMQIALGGSGPTFVTNTVTFKPSGGSPPTVVGSPSIFTASGASQMSITSPGRSLSSTNNWVLAWMHWYNPNGASIATLADSDGNSFLGACTSVSTSGQISSELCYRKPTTTHGSGYTVTATFSGAAGSSIYVYELSGAAASSPLDVSLNNTIIFGGVQLAEIVSGAIPASVTNELTLFCATWTDSQQHTATAGANYTLSQGSYRWSACEYTNATGIFGQEALAVTVNGSNAGVAKAWNCYIDGRTTCSAAQAPGVTYGAQGGYNSPSATQTSYTFYIDTTVWYNQPHQVAVIATNTNSTNCPGGSSSGCINGTWNIMGQWEQTETFANPVLPVELVTSARDQKAVCASFPCSTLPALAATVKYTDGSSSAATITSCISNDTTIVTVTSPGCVPTPIAYGSTYVTVTDSNGLKRQAWIYPVAQNNYPNIGNDGTVQTGYAAGNSSFVRSMFRAASSLADFTHQGSAFSGYTSAQFAADYAGGGYNTVEGVGFTNPPGVSTPATESAWDAQVQSDINYACSVLVNGLHPYFVADSWITSDGLFFGTRGPGLTFATPPMQYIWSQWPSLCPSSAPRGNTMADEVTSTFNTGTATPCGTGSCLIGTPNAPTSIVCVSGATCTLNCTMGPCTWVQGTFILTGSGTALDYNNTSGTPLIYAATGGSGGTGFTFPTPAGIGTITYTASSNNCGSGGTSSCAGLQFHPFVYVTYNASYQACSDATHNINPGPCVDWDRYNAFLNYHTWAKAGNSKALITYAPAGNVNSPSIESGWCGRSDVADTCDFYWSGPNAYIPVRASLNSIIAGMGDGYRASQGIFLTKPTTAEAEGITSNFAFTGYPVTVVSCAGNTITTASPHNLSNVFNGISRLWVSGSTGCNGRYFVVATPTATTITVVTPSTFTGSANGTITFVGGGTFTGVTNGICSGSFCSNTGGFGALFGFASCGTALKNNRGQYFHTSTGNSIFDNITWYYAIENVDPCGSSGELMWPVPNLSSTGGVAYIIPDHHNIRGRNWEGNGQNGARVAFASITYAGILGGAGTRQYNIELNMQAYDRAYSGGYSSGMTAAAAAARMKFNDGATINLQDDQAGPHPQWDAANSKAMFACSSIANLLTQRLAPWTIQPSLPSPDYGQWYEAAARQDGNGNTLLAIQQFADNTTTLTANLAPYLISGSAIIKYLASCDGGIVASTLGAGTMSDITTCKPGCFVAYVFDHSAASILNQPAIGASLADLTGAAKIQIRYSYSPYAFAQQSDILPQVYDCGTGACTLPVDRNIGPISFQVQYLDMNGRVLATGGTGQL